MCPWPPAGRGRGDGRGTGRDGREGAQAAPGGRPGRVCAGRHHLSGRRGAALPGPRPRGPACLEPLAGPARLGWAAPRLSPRSGPARPGLAGPVPPRCPRVRAPSAAAGGPRNLLLCVGRPGRALLAARPN